jgi:hypothetical protein
MAVGRGALTAFPGACYAGAAPDRMAGRREARLLNTDSVTALDGAGWGDHFIRPLYESYCFSRIPDLIRASLPGGAGPAAAASLLGPLARPYQKVVLLFVDAYGWRFWQQDQARFPFLRRFAEQGMVTRLTSQFPSTTAAHVTTMHTGLHVGQSGVYEWYYYEPLVDALIAPLFFSFAGDAERDSLRATGVAPAALFPNVTLYEGLAAQGVPSYVLQSRLYTPAPYSDVVCAGATLRPFRDLAHALEMLVDLLLEPGPGYYYCYFDRIDSAGHHFGPESPQWEAEVVGLMAQAEEALHARIAGRAHDTLLLMTADHGQVAVDPATTIYVNKALPEAAAWMRTGRDGRPLAPAGSARDLFLHIRPDYLATAEAALRDLLGARGEVHRTADLIDAGFFGPPPLSDAFLGRVGNLVALPYAGESIFWLDPPRFQQTFFGHHGGLTRAEMETQLLALAYD